MTASKQQGRYGTEHRSEGPALRSHDRERGPVLRSRGGEAGRRGATADISQTRQCLVKRQMGTRPVRTADAFETTVSSVLSGRGNSWRACFPAPCAGLISAVSSRQLPTPFSAK